MYTVVFSELGERDEEQEAKEKESALLLMMVGRQAGNDGNSRRWLYLNRW